MSEFINPPLLFGIAIAFIFYFTSWTFIIVLFAIFSALLGLIYFNQNKLLYMPGKYIFYEVVMNLPKSPSENSQRMRHPREHSL